MRKLLRHKNIVLILAFGGILALGILAAGIGDITFQPGRPFSMELRFPDAINPQDSAVAIDEIPSWQYFMFFAALVYILVVLFLMLKADTRKKLLKIFLQTVFWGIVIYIFVQTRTQGMLTTPPDPAAPPAGSSVSQAYPTEVFIPPDSDTTLSYIISAVVMIGMVLLALWVYRITRRQPPAANLHAELAGIARQAAHDIAHGEDWGDTIVRCYLRMTETVSAARGLKRGESVTPAEFARDLQKSGLPAEPIARLTHMFEAVRYGGKNSSTGEQQEAIFCLNAIVNACEGK